MSETCAIPKCERTSRAPCDCCKQNLCLQHLYEHNASLVSQLNPLTDEINALDDRLNRLNLHETARDCRDKLEEWRVDCHQKIDRFFKQKCQELDGLVSEKLDKQREKVLDIQTKLAKLIRNEEATRQDIDTLSSNIDDLQKEMNKIAEAHFLVNTRPLLINDTMVEFKDIHVHELDISTFPSVHKSIMYLPQSRRALASNGRVLLIHQAPNLCFLNAKLQIVKKVLWPYDALHGMCWSSTLDRFIVILKGNIFLVDENTMSIERVEMIAKQQWFSCTCFRDQLFLSTNTWGSSIVQIRLSPSVAVIKEWASPRTCTINEWIDDIVYDKETLAVMIRNNVEKSIYLKLRSCKTMDCLWSVLLDVVYHKNIAFHCFSIGSNEWLISDASAERLLHITKDEKINKTIPYKAIPYYITLFTSNMLAISTETGINLHKI